MGLSCLLFFFFNDTATTEIYTLSLHDALPICAGNVSRNAQPSLNERMIMLTNGSVMSNHLCRQHLDRKSTRLNSSHSQISYAVFCLKKKKKQAQKSHLPVPAHSTAW